MGHRSPRSLSSRRWWIRVRFGFPAGGAAGPDRYGGCTSSGAAGALDCVSDIVVRPPSRPAWRVPGSSGADVGKGDTARAAENRPGTRFTRPCGSALRHVLPHVVEPDPGGQVRRRPPVAARAQRTARGDLRAVGHRGALELAEAEEPLDEDL